MNNLVYGVGVNDLEVCGPSSFTIDGVRKMCPDYALWKGMLCRAVSEHEKVRRPACAGSSCHPDWYIRKNFQDWYFEQSVYHDSDDKILQIDKDILYINNQMYVLSTDLSLFGGSFCLSVNRRKYTASVSCVVALPVVQTPTQPIPVSS